MSDWGFTTLERDIYLHPIYENDKLFKLYSYLRIQARYENAEIFIDGVKTILKPGQLTINNRGLAKIFKTDPSTINRRLHRIKSYGKIIIEPKLTCTIITLTYWPQRDMQHECNAKRNANATQTATPIEPDIPTDEGQFLSSDCNGLFDVTATRPATEPQRIITSNINIKDIYCAVVAHLNDRAGTNYKPTSEATQRLINGRMKDGFTLDDFKRVIDTKVEQWKDDPKMRPYLRPQTLFSTKFEGYLNELPTEPKLPTRTVYE